MAAGRFQPYGTSCTRPYEYRNVEAGPSTLVASPVPYVDLSTSQPSGGIPETAADAETTQTITEEEKTSVSAFYCSHIPRVVGWSLDVRYPDKLGFPAAKEHREPGSGCRKMDISCATGSSGTKVFQELRLSMRPWPVSTYPVHEITHLILSTIIQSRSRSSPRSDRWYTQNHASTCARQSLEP